MDHTAKARIAITSTRQILNTIEERVNERQITSAGLEALTALEQQAGRTSNWILIRERLAEMPKSINAQDLEYQTHKFLGQRRATTAGPMFGANAHVTVD